MPPALSYHVFQAAAGTYDFCKFPLTLGKQIYNYYNNLKCSIELLTLELLIATAVMYLCLLLESSSQAQ